MPTHKRQQPLARNQKLCEYACDQVSLKVMVIWTERTRIGYRKFEPGCWRERGAAAREPGSPAPPLLGRDSAREILRAPEGSYYTITESSNARSTSFPT